MNKHKKAILPVLLTTGLFIFLLSAQTLVYLWLISQFANYIMLKVMIIIFGLVGITITIVVLRQRIQEIYKGEEDDLSKY
jgi:hypothetical protein